MNVIYRSMFSFLLGVSLTLVTLTTTRHTSPPPPPPPADQVAV